MEGCLTAICGSCGATMRGCRCGAREGVAEPLRGGGGAGCSRLSICLAIVAGAGALAGIMSGMYFWGKSENTGTSANASPSPIPSPLPSTSPPPSASPSPHVDASLALAYSLTGSGTAPGPIYPLGDVVGASSDPAAIFNVQLRYNSPSTLCLYSNTTLLGCGTATTSFPISAQDLAPLLALNLRSANMSVGGTARLCLSGPGITTPRDGCTAWALDSVPTQWVNITDIPSDIFFPPNITSCFMAQAALSPALPANTSALVQYQVTRSNPSVPLRLQGPIEHTFKGEAPTESISFSVSAEGAPGALRESCWLAPQALNATLSPRITALPARTRPFEALMVIGTPPPTENCSAIMLSPSIRGNTRPYTVFEPVSVKNNPRLKLTYPGIEDIEIRVTDQGPNDFSLSSGCPVDPVTDQHFVLQQTTHDAICLSPRAMNTADFLSAIKQPWGVLVDGGAANFPGMRLCLTVKIGSCGPYDLACVIMANNTASLLQTARIASAFLRGNTSNAQPPAPADELGL